MQKLLLLHGAIGSSKQFDALVPLLQNQFEVYILDFSGHGGKPIPDKPFSIELFAKDVLNWLEEKKIETINIFGYSMGGYVTLYLAKHQAEKVGKVFTLATKFNWNAEGAAKEAAMLNPEKIAAKVPAFANALEQKHGENWKTVLIKTADMMINLGKSPALSMTDLAAVQQPVQISVGDKDNMVTLEETIAAYRQLKNAQLLVLPQTQHPFEKVNTPRIAAEIVQYFG
ncbi:MAG: 2-succinyl-6-hydroxy-2,4-cyclohexadiene-1-carboxylate synthase [Bacteroidia bacterium]|nr:2-succinyl-6-hydroxy-2,4-cyclohexadiene-1-carboxylate synthase [Bacteroidia bacterium]